MVAARKQIEIGGLFDPAEEDAEIKAGHIWRLELWSAIKTFALSYREANLQGYDACAAALSRRWAPEGRHVTGALLRACVEGVERNNFRLEWAYWFADQDQDIAALLARKVKPTKTEAELRADLEAEIREEYPKQAEKLIRRARAR